MMHRGLVFTLGIILIGESLFSFSVVYDMISKYHTADNRLIELERATSKTTNLAHNAAKAFIDSSGIQVTQEGGKFTVKETLPNSLAEYGERIEGLKTSAKSLLNADVNLDANPEIVSGIGVNYTHVSDRKVVLQLPDETKSISLSANPTGGLYNCTLDYQPGPTGLNINVTGGGGVCIWSRQVNMTANNRFTMDNGALVLEVNDHSLSMEYAVNGWCAYTLSLEVNRSGYAEPPILDGEISAAAGRSKKSSKVELE